MSRIGKALFYIEGRLGDPELRLDEVARAVGVSRFHLSRLFATSLGQSAAAYLRARRVSEGAKALATGAPDILAVAIGVGYGSHEAFTRAFSDQFGMTPADFRANGAVASITLVDPPVVVADGVASLASPRIETAPARLIAGIGARYEGSGGMSGIPPQWRRLEPYFGHVPGAVGDAGFGVNHAFDQEGAFSYLAGMQVSHDYGLPNIFQTLSLPEQRCAVFTHKGHVSGIPASMRAIWEHWNVGADRQAIDCSCVEVYGTEFDASTGEGDVQIWVPVEG